MKKWIINLRKIVIVKMKLFKTKQSFEITTPLNEHEISNRISRIVDFNHKKKISTLFISKLFYGDVIDNNVYYIWKKPFFSGMLDKKMSPRIEIEISKGIVRFRIIDNMFLMPVIIFGLVFLAIIASIVNLIITFGFIEKEFIYMMITFLIFPIIGILIDRFTFFSTIKNVKKRFEYLLISSI